MSSITENKRAIKQMAALYGDPQRDCKRCEHRAKAGNCTKPVEAGLSREFGIFFADQPWVAMRCKAFKRRGAE